MDRASKIRIVHFYKIDHKDFTFTPQDPREVCEKCKVVYDAERELHEKGYR